PSPLSLLCDVESWTPGRDVHNGSQPSSRRSFGSSTSDNDRLRQRGEQPTYSFVGMHCIFDQCRASVTVLKFGHMSSDLLAYRASDGTLTVCTVSDPPSILKHLNGHSKDVTVDAYFFGKILFPASSSPLGYGTNAIFPVFVLNTMSCLFSNFDFSSNNQYIASSSLDKTVRVWEISKGLCIRVIYGVSPQLCIRFHPVNGKGCIPTLVVSSERRT
ncbi:nuclear distribution protein PAC1-1-like, partial [Rosa rugosa]|uniref:nuclear distribution protein PAC1-1-like n=1 Tax=Rosa rugosa TaxID=74645 RepID=UPI002B40910D